MKFSKSYVKTLKETPKEAEVISHKLMLRASMIKRLASGVYTFLPLGLRALKKVEKIVREEMDRSGAQEIFMPVLQPAELWKESGRWSVMGPELMRLEDRHEREFALGPTHEEVITDLIKNDLSSYKSLPINFYQIQTKFRDERRPRFGLMRGREFLMKDAYSFHGDNECLDKEFNNMRETYERIFMRCGLKFRSVEADSGAIGGSGSREFHVLAESGEDEILYCDTCDYASNIESAKSKPINYESIVDLLEPELIHTPNLESIEEVSKFLGVSPATTVKALMYKDMVTDEIYIALIRGDYEINEIKLKNILGAVAIELLTKEEIKDCGFIRGFVGPYKQENAKIKIIADKTVVDLKNQIVGGNKKDYHCKNVNYGRDYRADIVTDIRLAKVDEECHNCNGHLHSARGIETGHIFKLGDKYSKAMNATFLDENGKSKYFIMGCYGVGVSRTLAAAIEQNNDEFGIIWPSVIAPYLVDVIPANIKDEQQAKLAQEVYNNLLDEDIDTIFDDRDERIGFKFKDADLIGFPFKVVVGKKAGDRIVELKIRRTGETIELPSGEVVEKIKELSKIY